MEPRRSSSDGNHGITGNINDHEIIRQLTELLRANGERILSGQSKLSLTTRSLCVLNEKFVHLLGEDEFVTSFDVVPPNSPKMPYVQDIQFLYDFMQKTIALKILHVSSTLQGRVSLGPFRALTILEVKKTPLHLLEGIQRMRARLTTIICARSLSNLQELFESCGGDLSSPMSWPELHTACLSFNMIEKLDSSLRLVPRLEVLDLSHNSISETDRCLEYLTELIMLNLGYNRLSHVPSLAISVREKLGTLILRNNDIESLQGIEELSGLRELDVSYNCICDHHTALANLRSLHRLSILLLKGNPISFHGKHRLLTISCLNEKAAKKVIIDEKPVTLAEIEASNKFRVTVPVSSARSSSGGRREGLRARFSETSLDMSPGSATHSETDTPHKGKAGRRSGRPGRKVRRALISDLDSGCDAESDLPEHSPDTSRNSTPHNSEHLDVKKHMETMRAQLGPDWLQTLVTHKTSPDPDPTHKPHTPTTTTTQPQQPNKPQSPSLNIASPPSPPLQPRNESVGRVAKFAIGSVDDEDYYLNAENHIAASSPRPTVTYNYFKNDVAGSREKDNGDTLSDHMDMVKDSDTGSGKVHSSSSVLVKSTESTTIYDRHCSHTDQVDYGVESEPFIVSHLGETEVHRLVNISPRYLLEKDINGDIIEALDLKCLMTVEEMAVGAMAQDGVLDSDQNQDNGPVIKLTFDLVKKDRRERNYVMEDEASSEGILALLRPILEVNRAQINIQDQMQCLKCNKEFSKQAAARTVKKHGSVHVSIDTYSSSIEIGDLSEGLLCPFCSSEMLIKMETSCGAFGSAVNTPVGSFKEPMATSSANPSPWKLDAMKRSDSSPKFRNSPSTRPIPTSALDDSSRAQSPLVTSSAYHTPRETMYHTPPSQSTSPLTPDHSPSFKSMLSSDMDNNNTTSSPTLKTAYMSQSAIEISTHDTEKQHPHNASMTTPVENKAFQRNGSAQEIGRYRNRQDSGSSDILVLSRHPNIHTFPSQESDIAVLSNPSETSIAVIDSTVSSRDTLDDIEDVWEGSTDHVFLTSDCIALKQEAGDGQRSIDSELSPSGSLTNKTLSSMISTVYEKTIADGKTIGVKAMVENHCDDTVDGVTVVSSDNEPSSFQSSASTPKVRQGYNPFDDDDGETENGHLAEADQVVSGSFLDKFFPAVLVQLAPEDPSKIKFFQDSCRQVDHRLKLYLMMSVFSLEDEELSLILRCGIFQYSKDEEQPGVVIVSSHRIYFYKIKGPEKAENIEKWLKCIQSYPLSELRYVDIGLGFQTLKFEFGNETCYKLIIRDFQRCHTFTSAFTEQVQHLITSAQSKLEGISKSNATTLENLTRQVLEEEGEEGMEEQAPSEDMAAISPIFIMAYQHTGELDASGGEALTPVSVVITPSELHLVVENHQWPRPRALADVNVKGQQFTPKDRQRITDISAMDLDHAAPLDISVDFYDEESSEECQWRLTLETRSSLEMIVDNIRTLWEKQYGVELQINIADTGAT